jgi:hypothetical protein
MAIPTVVLEVPLARRILIRTLRAPRQCDHPASVANPGARHRAPAPGGFLPIAELRHVVDDLDNLENATWEDAEWQ